MGEVPLYRGGRTRLGGGQARLWKRLRRCRDSLRCGAGSGGVVVQEVEHGSGLREVVKHLWCGIWM